MNKLNSNTILQGYFVFNQVGFITIEQPGALTGDLLTRARIQPGRGPVVAVDFVNTGGASLFGASQQYFFNIGGVEFIEGDSANTYYVYNQNHRRQLLQKAIPDNQQCTLQVGGFVTAFEEHTFILIREGGRTNRPFSGRTNTFVIGRQLELNLPGVAGASQEFVGTIPKNRGRCVGFGFSVNTRVNDQPSQQLNNNIVTLVVDGTERISRIPLCVFLQESTTRYKKIFQELGTGATYRIIVQGADPVLPGFKLNFRLFFDE